MLIIGHRGAAGWEDENTLASFRRAVELGVDMIEMDVHLCADGDLIVIHDETLDRTSNGRGRVTEASLPRIQACRTRRGQIIPTLAEALEAINRRAAVNIELKGPRTAEALGEAMTDFLGQGWRLSDFLISSFDREALLEFQRTHPDARIGLLLKKAPADWAALAGGLHLESINMSLQEVTPALVQIVHMRGWKLYVWTVNRRSEIKRMRDMGVDGVFTDYPDRAQPDPVFK